MIGAEPARLVHCVTARNRGDTARTPLVLAEIDQGYTEEIRTAVTKPDRTAFNLAAAMYDCRNYILTFTPNLEIPFDNNQAERDLRMMKIHQKISGGRRTLTGAHQFATIRSYIETARKHHHDPLDALHQLFTTTPWTPTTT